VVGLPLNGRSWTDLANLLLNIVNPNAEIREGYENFLVTTRDGRVISGFLVEQDPQVVVLRGLDGQNISLARAEVLGHDLKRPHRAMIVEGGSPDGDESAFFHVVRRVTRRLNLGALLVSRAGAVVVLCDLEVHGEVLREAILADIGRGTVRVGVGGWALRPNEIPRSYREAQLALSMPHGDDQHRSVHYDDLGVYKLLCEVQDPTAVERFVRVWLGALLDYDDSKHSELVPTLARYLECGASWERAAASLCVHRSTLKYRLQRIRDISQHDLADPATNFNLQLATRAWQTLQTLRL